MGSTVTKVNTLAAELDNADPNRIADALRKVKLGTHLTPTKYVSGTITGVAAVPLNPPALIVQSARVVSSGTAASVGVYIASDAGATPLLPPGGASTAVGVAALSDDGKTLTFPNTVTSVVIEYIPRSSADVTADFGAV